VLVGGGQAEAVKQADMFGMGMYGWLAGGVIVLIAISFLIGWLLLRK